ncbi:pancreatic adenocarcinoma up-regulated factor [Bos mutus]|uniref:pancreatic adenocarcinoma up-regulated factor n=1 Tax=Bos mutus TaxID=72004 RepID=UPI0038B67C7A
MLLWLTLAFLWSPTCWAQQKYGPGGGTYFSTSRDFQNDITGIRVFIGPLGLIKSIQVRFGSSWSEKYGAPGGTPQEVILLPEEHITGIYGSYKNFLRHLVIYTDRGRLFPFGKEDGNTFIAVPDESDKVLIRVCGHYKLLGITSIGFEWGYPSFLNK